MRANGKTASNMAMENSRTQMETVIKACGTWESSKVQEDSNTQVDPYTSAIGWTTRGMAGDHNICMMARGTKANGSMVVLMVTALFSSLMEYRNMKVSGIKAKSTVKEQKHIQMAQCTQEPGTAE